MPISPVLPKLVGQRVKRREDPRLIQGRATYVDDIALVGMQHIAFKRSDVAHGRIVSIDTSAAEAMEGVEAVFTGAQIAELLAPMPIGTPFPSPEHRAVAVDTVRYGGEPVAVVVASDRYLARDAAEAIVVSYDMLPAVVDLELAMTGKPALASFRVSEQRRRGGAAQRHRSECLGSCGRHRRRRSVQEGGSRHLTADGQSAPRAVGDGAQGCGCPLRARQGHDDDLVLDAEPAHFANVRGRA